MPSSALVAPAIAETTTMGLRSNRPRTISTARVIASAFCTEVPPNLRTITRGSRGKRAARHRELRVEHRSAGGAANGVVRHRDEAEVEHRISAHAAHYARHAAAGHEVT